VCFANTLCSAQLETRFHGDKIQLPGPFSCKVKFEGVSVIEGIKELVPLGVAVVPLPPHLANLHSSAKNHFLLRDRDEEDAPNGQ
jgi:hypothetical protein